MYTWYVRIFEWLDSVGLVRRGDMMTTCMWVFYAVRQHWGAPDFWAVSRVTQSPCTKAVSRRSLVIQIIGPYVHKRSMSDCCRIRLCIPRYLRCNRSFSTSNDNNNLLSIVPVNDNNNLSYSHMTVWNFQLSVLLPIENRDVYTPITSVMVESVKMYVAVKFCSTSTTLSSIIYYKVH